MTIAFFLAVVHFSFYPVALHHLDHLGSFHRSQAVDVVLVAPVVAVSTVVVVVVAE